MEKKINAFLKGRNLDTRIAWLKGSGKAKSYTERGTMRLGRKEGAQKM